ncbi:MAG TPA: HDOD domain-containing protein, partial [Syntrophales bacterium]|nr:HDOD domain-containing protein [Syntrophales bacterium]
VVNHVTNLKHYRSEHIRLQKLINDPALKMSDLSKVILVDPILTAKILKMANSPYFGIPHKINSINHALMILGLQNIMNILYREGLLQLFQAGSPEQEEAVAALWKHSNIVSICASGLCDLFEGLNKGTLFTLGIIHDIGKLIMLGLPQVRKQEASLQGKYPASVSIYDEDQFLGINHAVIGQIALEHWNFSELMIKAVAMHHAPAFASAKALGLDEEQQKYVTIIFIADQVAKLFAGRETGTMQVYPLLSSYHPLIDRNRLINKIMDVNFLAQIREAETIAVFEHKGKSANAAAGPNRMRQSVASNHAGLKAGAMTSDTPATGMTSDSVRKIGRYEIIRELGHGAMGTVYLGRDPLINREVVIKTLRHQDADDEQAAEAKSRFFREAEALGKLSHPNIVTVFDVGEYEGATYMAMELLDGSDLIPYCKRNNLLPVHDVIRIISSAAIALHFAHENGVVHRDIKPGNIHILKKGDVKILDFGIARVVETSKTHTGIIIGSPSYMSPEQVEGQKLDGRSDIFSLGAVLYELLSGERPFKGDSLTSLLHQITAVQPVPIKILCPSVPDSCVAVIEKALAKDKEKRYQSGMEMANDLAKCLKEL